MDVISYFCLQQPFVCVRVGKILRNVSGSAHLCLRTWGHAWFMYFVDDWGACTFGLRKTKFAHWKALIWYLQIQATQMLCVLTRSTRIQLSCGTAEREGKKRGSSLLHLLPEIVDSICMSEFASHRLTAMHSDSVIGWFLNIVFGGYLTPLGVEQVQSYAFAAVHSVLAWFFRESSICMERIWLSRELNACCTM